MTDLFDNTAHDDMPLAARMRPHTLDDYIGQEHILGEGKLLRRSITADQITSLVLYGPPGTGKTSLAEVIANTTQSHFEALNAAACGIADVRRAIEEAINRKRDQNKKTILFIDELHRFNKAQQDILLPDIEYGTIRLIGATTHNPFFYVNAPLISRSQIFELQPLTHEHILRILHSALKDNVNGLGKLNVDISTEALDFFARYSDGDARRALNGIELAVKTTPANAQKQIVVTLDIAQESIQKKAILYDKDEDGHYDTISAFIKSMRGSDPDAALYWMAKMLEAGEDPRYITRRMMIHAAEDVGMADPTALLVAVAADHALERVGLPEARIPMAQACIHIACAPKSPTACDSISAAQNFVQAERLMAIPKHLRDSHYASAKILGNGTEYKLPHNFPDGWIDQSYMPHNVEFYKPTNYGAEAKAAARIADLKSRRANRQPPETTT